MKKIKEFLDRMDEKFEKTDWTFLWNVIFPFSMLFKRKKKQTDKIGQIIHVPTQTLWFKVQKDISQFQKLYGESADIGMSMEMIKKAMVNELMEQIAQSGAVEFKSYKQVGGNYFDKQILEAEIRVVKRK